MSSHNFARDPVTGRVRKDPIPENSRMENSTTLMA